MQRALAALLKRSRLAARRRDQCGRRVPQTPARGVRALRSYAARRTRRLGGEPHTQRSKCTLARGARSRRVRVPRSARALAGRDVARARVIVPPRERGCTARARWPWRPRCAGSRLGYARPTRARARAQARPRMPRPRRPRTAARRLRRPPRTACRGRTPRCATRRAPRRRADRRRCHGFGAPHSARATQLQRRAPRERPHSRATAPRVAVRRARDRGCWRRRSQTGRARVRATTAARSRGRLSAARRRVPGPRRTRRARRTSPRAATAGAGSVIISGEIGATCPRHRGAVGFSRDDAGVRGGEREVR